MKVFHVSMDHLSANLCIDEIFSCWYGLGGIWAFIGLPHYVKFDCKPKAGCEIYTACDGEGKFIFAVEIVTGEKSKKYRDEYGAGTAAILQIAE